MHIDVIPSKRASSMVGFAVTRKPGKLSRKTSTWICESRASSFVASYRLKVVRLDRKLSLPLLKTRQTKPGTLWEPSKYS